jgi:hypothetical protein
MPIGRNGAYEFCSPKLPQHLEAVIVHSLDNLDSKVQAIQNLLDKAPRSKGTVFHRACGRNFYRQS